MLFSFGQDAALLRGAVRRSAARRSTFQGRAASLRAALDQTYLRCEAPRGMRVASRQIGSAARAAPTSAAAQRSVIQLCTAQPRQSVELRSAVPRRCDQALTV